MRTKRRFAARDLVFMLNDTPEEIAARLNLDQRTVYKWVRKDWHFTEWEADRIAIRCGTHPGLIWRDSWWQVG